MSRLTIDISDQQHQSLKAMAALQGKTIRQYALERLFPGDADGDKAWQELKALLGARIDEGLADLVGSAWTTEVHLPYVAPLVVLAAGGPGRTGVVQRGAARIPRRVPLSRR